MMPDVLHVRFVKMASTEDVAKGLATTDVRALSQMSCDDFREFKEALQSLRSIDDKIIYNLNKSVPTSSFQHEVDAEAKCQELYKQLLDVYKLRENSIKHCIRAVSEEVETLKKRQSESLSDFDAVRDLRKHQTTLRLMQSELNVEEVVKQRSIKVFNEKCWKAYKPPKTT